MELYRVGKSSERVSLWREAIREIPNDLLVLRELMSALQSEDMVRNSDEIIEYGKRILEESTDTSLRNSAIQSLCYAYYRRGDKENAKKYANMASIYHISSNQLMARVLDGEEAVICCQKNIQALFDLIASNTSLMMQNANYTTEETIEACQFVIDCFSLLYPDGNFGFYHVRISDFYEKLAHNYLKLGDEMQMLSCLEKSAEHAIQFDIPKDGMYIAFMVNRVKLSSIDAVKSHTENRSGLLLKALMKEKFSPWQNDERMQTIIEKLKPMAIM